MLHGIRGDPMDTVIEEVGPERLADYAGVSIAFVVETVLEIDPAVGGLGGIGLREVAIEESYVRDYDAHENAGPPTWPNKFDVSNWAFFLAMKGSRPVGAATVAFDTPGVHMLAGRKDIGVLWDIRVAPELRRSGIGRNLFREAVRWVRRRGCRQLKIETQNVNVPACRFYFEQGCHLGEINRYAYATSPEVAHEVQLIWYLDL
jgi:GNAT superfamily N-acetyltransferase